MSSPAALLQSRRVHASPTLARALAVVVALHGLAHFAGAGDALTKARDGDSAEYLAGAWTVSDPALLRSFGVVWALVGAAFVVAAAVAWLRHPVWPRGLAAVSGGSLVVLTVALWASVIGVVIDLALLALAWRADGFAREGRRR